MKYRYTHGSAIINYPDIYPKYNQEILNLLSKLEKASNIEEVKEWTICFRIVFSYGTPPATIKKGTNYPSDKEKEYPIIAPIPLISEASWGITPEAAAKTHTPEAKYLIPFECDYRKYATLDDYVNACTKIGIIKYLTDGIVLKGNKIKISNIEILND